MSAQSMLDRLSETIYSGSLKGRILEFGVCAAGTAAFFTALYPVIRDDFAQREIITDVFTQAATPPEQIAPVRYELLDPRGRQDCSKVKERKVCEDLKYQLSAAQLLPTYRR